MWPILPRQHRITCADARPARGRASAAAHMGGRISWPRCALRPRSCRRNWHRPSACRRARISKIGHGEVAGIDVVGACVAAFGGTIDVIGPGWRPQLEARLALGGRLVSRCSCARRADDGTVRQWLARPGDMPAAHLSARRTLARSRGPDERRCRLTSMTRVCWSLCPCSPKLPADQAAEVVISEEDEGEKAFFRALYGGRPVRGLPCHEGTNAQTANILRRS